MDLPEQPEPEKGKFTIVMPHRQGRIKGGRGLIGNESRPIQSIPLNKLFKLTKKRHDLLKPPRRQDPAWR